MTLNYLGEFSAAPTSPAENDAYYNTTSNVYKYYNGNSWADYTPIKVIKEVLYVTVYAVNGAPDDSSNEVQFPSALGVGDFALDVTTGSFYGHDGSDWSSAWTGTAVISL